MGSPQKQASTRRRGQKEIHGQDFNKPWSWASKQYKIAVNISKLSEQEGRNFTLVASMLSVISVCECLLAKRRRYNICMWADIWSFWSLFNLTTK